MQVKEEEEDSSPNQFIFNSTSSHTTNNSAPSVTGGSSAENRSLQAQLTFKRQQTPAFLEKLFDILEEDNDFHHLIAWQPDGNSFLIKKVNEFSEIVLPKYFKHSNIQSYIRQLNMYGFSKTRHDSNHHEFTHKLFQRGRRDLLPFIRRKTQNTTATTSSSSIMGGSESSVVLKGENPDFQSLQLGGKVGKGSKKLAASLALLNRTNTNFSGNLFSVGNSANNISSEASSNGMEDEMHEYLVHSHNLPLFSHITPDKDKDKEKDKASNRRFSNSAEKRLDLEQRVQLLERQVGSLTEFSLALLQKHDQLCEALQFYVEMSESLMQRRNFENSDSPSGMMNIVSDHSNGNDFSSNNSDSGNSSSFSGRGPSNQQPFTSSSLKELDEVGPPLKRLKSLDGSMSSYGPPSSSVPQSMEESDPSSDSQKRPREMASGLSKRVNFLEFQSDKLSALLPAVHFEFTSSSAGQHLKKRSLSLDLGGLEAITAAAQYLEDANSPTPAGPLLSRRQVNWDSYSSVLMSRANAGGALTKSISYGYEYSLSSSNRWSGSK